MFSLLSFARYPLRIRTLLSFSRFFSTQTKKCVNITFAWNDGRKKTVPAKLGDNLLDIVLDNDVDIDGFGACEGTLACSTCHLIFAKKDFDNLHDPLTEEEQDMLDLAYGLTDTSRLGCQGQYTMHAYRIIFRFIVQYYIYNDILLVGTLIDLSNANQMTAIKLHKSTKPILKEAHDLKISNHTILDGDNNNNNNAENDISQQQRKNKNLAKLKKYRKRQLKKKYSRKQLTARKALQWEHEQPVKRVNEIQEEALNYLRIWKMNYDQWKFKKLLQSWLIKNVLDKEMVPTLEFRIFKCYVKKLIGSARQDLLNRCSAVIIEEEEKHSNTNNALDTCTKLVNKEDISSEEVICQQKSEYSIAGKRAKKLLKILSQTS
ncbi:unnamed protein product [Schistosoma turkestanicum]|nr:unnamed protein product [Schistosoma turkestanicum]